MNQRDTDSDHARGDQARHHGRTNTNLRSLLRPMMAAAWAVLAAMLLAAHVVSAAPVMAPAFLWAPKNYGFSSDGTKEVVHYQTISPNSLAKSVLQEGGWSNLVCSREDAHNYVDVAIVFLGSKLQSSDISKDKQVDPALADTEALIHKFRVFHGIPLCFHNI